jgi:hypothetical protein
MPDASPPRRYVAPSDADLDRLDAQWSSLGRADRQAWRTREASRPWIFIIGCNNSGTTLLYEMLGLHSEITLLPHEGQYLTRLLPLPATAGCPRVWTERLDVFRLTEEDDGVDGDRLVFDWVSQAERPLRRLIAEKSPPNTLRSRWLQKVFPAAAFIAIVRSGYAVAEGVRRRQGYDLERCAQHWSLANHLMLEDAERLERFLLVRYEDLLGDFTGVAESIATFLQIDGTALLGFPAWELTVHNMDNAASRLSDYNHRSLANLSATDLDAIERGAGPMLKRLGYQRPAR